MMLTFDELRQIKHNLPTGSVAQLATEFGVSDQTIRNYFGASKFEQQGEGTGLHIGPGPQGGIVEVKDPAILNRAKEIINTGREPQVAQKEA